MILVFHFLLPERFTKGREGKKWRQYQAKEVVANDYR